MAEKTQMQFEYPELKPRQIRLLQVSRNESSDRIICSFAVVSLDNLESAYTAISYCWGDTALTDKVWFDDCRFLGVNNSAANILRKLISDRFKGYLWIDAICINQDGNKSEKGQQVRLMREIYSLAKQVTAWIGHPSTPPSTDSDLALKFTRTLDDAITDLYRVGKPVTYNAITESPLCEYPSLSWSALVNLLKRAWFQRIWVVQEVVVASQVVIVCGEESVPWITLARVIMMINGKGFTRLLSSYEDGRDSFLPDGVTNICTTYSIKAIRDSGAPVRLQTNLLDTRKFGATDPRDKLFALLGFVTDGDDTALHPDYHESKTTQVTYTNHTAYLIARDRSLEILHAAGIGLPRSLVNLPSWVVDWSCPPTGTTLGAIAKRAEYRAAGNSEVQVLEGIKDSYLPKLVIEGCFVDKIKMVCLPSPEHVNYADPSLGNPLRREEFAWFKSTSLVIDSLKPYPTGEEMKDVYWRTLIANVSYTGTPGTPAPQEYARYFDSYWALKYLILTRESQGTVRGATPDMAHGSERWTAAWSPVIKRVLFTTDHGYAGLGPPGLKQGDAVSILYGGATPFILRNGTAGENSKLRHVVVGECYIHGLMNGEGLDIAPSEPIVLI